MEIRLDPQQGFVTKDGKFNQKEALINAGVKAAVCFKEPKDGEVITPWDIRNDSESSLIIRGINTIISDHTTPTEHQPVGLEITGIPKILCMILNNEQFYTADERSLRYTEVEPNDLISELEVKNYKKWLKKFIEIITDKYFDFYRKFNKDDESTHKAIKKMAQENARYQVSVFMPTTLTYTVPFIQINKVAKYMEKFIEAPKNDFEEKIVLYMKEFINKLKELNVLLIEGDIAKLVSDEDYQKIVKRNPQMINYAGSDSLIYKNNKNIDLSIFASRNKFSGISLSNEYGTTISYNHQISFACYAQEQRHRTANCEFDLLKKFKAFMPPILSDFPKLQEEWIKDMQSVAKFYPQGQLIQVNINSSLKRILSFIATERCCDRAQLEIERLYVNMIKDIHTNLKEEGKIELANSIKPYVGKLRCAFPEYNCPGKCGHPRINRDL